jgi:hypothetical protein
VSGLSEGRRRRLTQLRHEPYSRQARPAKRAAQLDETQDGGQPGGHEQGMAASPMHQLSGCHVAQPKIAGQVRQRTTLHRRLPEGLPFPVGQLFEDGRYHLPIQGCLFGRAGAVAVSRERDHHLAQPLPAAQDVEAVIASYRDQPGADVIPSRSRPPAVERP